MRTCEAAVFVPVMMAAQKPVATIVRRQRQLALPRRLAPGKEMLRADLMPACHL
jgi:hypothetical protein